MNKHIEEKMCSVCYDNINNCNHKKWFNVDSNMFNIISTLNKKGYKTICCCEGHEETEYDFDGCVGFDKKYQFKKELPDILEFKFGNGKFKNTYWIYCKNKKYNTLELKNDFLFKLEEWVKEI